MERATFEASALLRTRFDVRAALDECIAAAGLRAAASDRWLHDARSAHTPPSSQQRRSWLLCPPNRYPSPSPYPSPQPQP